jgi:hypothetical protein
LGELVAATDGLENVRVATFDGDTPKEDRNYIRENANVVRFPFFPSPSPLSFFRLSAHLLSHADLHQPGHAPYHHSPTRRTLAALLPEAEICRRRRVAHLLGTVRVSYGVCDEAVRLSRSPSVSFLRHSCYERS